MPAALAPPCSSVTLERQLPKAAPTLSAREGEDLPLGSSVLVPGGCHGPRYAANINEMEFVIEQCEI